MCDKEKTNSVIQEENTEEVNDTSQHPDEWKDKYVRLYADFDNYKKRIQKEKENVKRHIRELIAAMLQSVCAGNENECKMQFINQFTQKYDDRQNYKKATVYKAEQGDQFIDFCREVYMK